MRLSWLFSQPAVSASARVPIVVAIYLLAVGCATPTSTARSFARTHGFEEEVVRGDGYRHQIWRKTGPPSVLHVYIEGDGTPHPTPTTVARDPTPSDPVMLHLMALDPHASVYVGRPCYWGLYADSGCSAYAWTLGRFSAAIVQSMVAVILKEAAAHPGARIVIYGHSGGAALALLTATKGLHPAGIVTVAGNLDTDAWTSLHGYTPLIGSLNPAKEPLTGPPPSIRHYVGENDVNTPPALIRAASGCSTSP